MPDNHDVVAALPHDGAANKELLRDLLVQRMPYALAADENAGDLVAVDPQSGATILAIVQFGYLFSLDPDDSTTAHDDVTCLVSFDGKRYKRDGLTQPYAVLDKDLTEPPDGSPGPAFGDAYLLFGTPSDDWAGEIGKIAIFTARGWAFAQAPIGFKLYVEDEDAYYHRDSDGDWVAGLGTYVVADGSVSPLALINLSAGGVLRVVNQTTNAPPGSPTKGDAYIIGPNPTGDWSGHAGKIALSIIDGSFLSPITPLNGWTAFDISLNTYYKFNGTAWLPQSGGFTQAFSSSKWDAELLALIGGNSQGYAYSAWTPPASTQAKSCLETLTVPVQAEFAGQWFEIEYLAAIDGFNVTYATTGQIGLSIGLFVDSEVLPRTWMRLRRDDWQTNQAGHIRAFMEFYLTDTSAHTIKIILFPNSGSNMTTGGGITVSRRTMAVRMRGSTFQPAGGMIETWLSNSYLGDMTENGGLASVFDGVTSQALGACATVTGTDGFVGIVMPRGERISRALIYGSSNQGYIASANPSITIEMYGKQGGAPSNSTDGTLIGSITFTDTANENTGREISSTDPDTVFDHVWFRIDPGSSVTMHFAEARLFR